MGNIFAEIRNLEKILAQEEEVEAQDEKEEEKKAQMEDLYLDDSADLDEEMFDGDLDDDFLGCTAAEEEEESEECEEEESEESEEKEAKKSSEEEKGVEDTIKMPFQEVSEEVGANDGELPNEVVTKQTKSDYVARLVEASTRLDRVAEYLEKHGKTAAALRIDKISDALDAECRKLF
jgi:hypothetical protein